MTTPTETTSFADPVSDQRLQAAAEALRAHGFAVEILDDAAAARSRIEELIPQGATVFTGASETLRRVQERCLPLESERAKVVYGQPSAVNRLLVLNAEPHPARATVLLVREAIGF